MSVHTDGEYFVQEDTGKHLVRELVNFKFRVHQLIPKRLREQVFSELDAAVDKSLTSALNFELLDEYGKMNDLYSQFAKETDINKEIQMEKLNELKEQWLSEHPDSTHPLDLRRFIRYAVALARVAGGLDHAEMAHHGISEKRIEEYQRQYEFLREVLVVLDEQS